MSSQGRPQGSNVNSQSSSSRQVSVLDLVKYRRFLVRYIISTDLPLSHVESPGFVRFVRYLNPNVPLLSRDTLGRDILRYFEIEKVKVKKHVSDGEFVVAITCDIWSDKANVDYISVASHNIDKEWVLQKRMIGFKIVEKPHSCANILEIMVEIMKEWGLGKRIVSLTLDNATTESEMFSNLVPVIDGPKIFLHQRCSTDVINSMVKSAVKMFEPSVSKIRYYIDWMNSSTSRVDELGKRQKDSGLGERGFEVDFETRWDATLFMLRNFLAKDYIDVSVSYIRHVFGQEAILDDDIRMAELFLGFLDLFYSQSCQLSAVYSPTCNLAIHSVLGIAYHLHECKNSSVGQECIFRMKKKFLKYWGAGKIPYLYGLGTILDPRIKFEGYSMCLEYLTELLDDQDYVALDYAKVEDMFYEIFRDYEKKYTETVVEPQHQSSSMFAILARFKSENSPDSASFSFNEINLYKSVCWAKLTDESLDVLKWWKEHEMTFPILSRFAHDILTIPVSTVSSSESAFCSAGRVIDIHRTCSAPDMVEAMTVGKDWFLAETRKQEQLIDVDLADLFANVSVD